MESKLWIKLCALLLLFLSALASHADSNAPERPDLLNVSNNNTDSGHGSTAENVTIPLILLPKSNETVTNSTELPEIYGNFTEDSTQITSLPVSETPPTQKSPPTSTVLISTNKNDTSTVATPTTASHVAFTNTSHHIVPVNATTTTSKPTHSTTALSQVPQTNVTEPTASSTTAQTSTTASKPKMTTTDAQFKKSQFSNAKAHADTPSQLNVGGDTTAVHDAPTVDPLLAGLVSAFVITAVIITLLLFLKLRRRDTRPEFRRLQELPMDDMEDAPLSMYSY